MSEHFVSFLEHPTLGMAGSAAKTRTVVRPRPDFPPKAAETAQVRVAGPVGLSTPGLG